MAPVSRPKLSIVVPCYNTRALLPRCVDSLLAQTLDDIEIVLVNDGSTDGSLELMRDYERRRPDVVRVVDKANGGLWNARWSGTDAARGDYVAYVDSDDSVDPTFASDLYGTAVREGADIVVCGFRRVAEGDGAVLSTEMDEPRATFVAHEEPGRLIEINPAAWNKCFRRGLLMSMRRLDEPPLILEDVTLSQLAYLASEGRVAFTGTAPYSYLVREGSMINSVTLEQVESVKRALLEVRRDFERDGADEALLQELDATVFLHLGVSMSFRLSCSRDVDLGAAVARTTAYLDENFPTWRRSPYMGPRIALSRGGSYLRLTLAQWFYRAHLLRPFLAAYRLYLRHSGRDLKW